MTSLSQKLLPVAATVGLLLAGACDPYAPSLGDTPFRCGADGGCPRGYECILTDEVPVCTRAHLIGDGDAGVDEGDGGTSPEQPFTCADDGQVEPNDATAEATVTPIPASTNEYELASLSICPSDDIDLFAFELPEDGMAIIIDIQYRSGRGKLELDLLNDDGISLRPGIPVDGDFDHLRAQLPAALAGRYYAQVRASAADIRNNYGIAISIAHN